MSSLWASQYNKVKVNAVCPLSLPRSRCPDRARNARYQLGIIPVKEKREKEEEQLGEAFRLWYRADTVKVLRKEGIRQERLRQPMRSWCIGSSHRAASHCPELQALVQQLCLVVHWADPQATCSQKLLAPCTPCSKFSLEWMAEWCTIMVSFHL